VEPENFKALLRRGAAFLEMDQEGSIEKSVADIENALSQEPENQELQKLHDTALRKVRQYIDKQVRQTSTPQSTTIYRQYIDNTLIPQSMTIRRLHKV
jgi:hypothetical protein